MTWLPIVGLLVGLGLLWPSVWSIRYVWKRTADTQTQRARLRLAITVLGLISACLVSSIGYYADPVTRVIGFPFLSVVFQKRGDGWLDFLGPLTIPALLANAFLGFALPFLLVTVWWRVMERSR